MIEMLHFDVPSLGFDSRIPYEIISPKQRLVSDVNQSQTFNKFSNNYYPLHLVLFIMCCMPLNDRN